MKIKKGTIFHCKKDFIMEDGNTAYTAGKTYYSETEDCITDNNDNENHFMYMIHLEDYFNIEDFKSEEVKFCLCTGSLDITGTSFKEGYVYPSRLVKKIPNIDSLFTFYFIEIYQNINL